jgi:hypothetical protein
VWGQSSLVDERIVNGGHGKAGNRLALEVGIEIRGLTK